MSTQLLGVQRIIIESAANGMRTHVSPAPNAVMGLPLQAALLHFEGAPEALLPQPLQQFLCRGSTEF
jgi:hypothetical protein